MNLSGYVQLQIIKLP